MDLFSKTNLPVTIIMALIAWAWLSLISVLLGSLL
jgi:hypothetical protein